MHQAIVQKVSSFLNDPPDSPFQRGYLSALVEVLKEAGVEPELVAQAEALLPRRT